MRPDDNVIVRFTQRYDVYNRDEIAGFPARLAARLVKAGGAVVVRPKGFDADKMIGITANEPKGPSEADQLKRAKIIGAFSACSAAEDREKDGRPKSTALSDILGWTVSDQERDKAWEHFRPAAPVAEGKATAA